MNTTKNQGQWEQLKGRAKRAWGELTEDDFKKAEGSKDKLVGIIRERFGDTTEQINNKLEEASSQLNEKVESTSKKVSKALDSAGEMVNDGLEKIKKAWK